MKEGSFARTQNFTFDITVEKLIARARAQGSQLIVVDTPSFVAGIYGQTLNYFMMDGARPDSVLAFERGGFPDDHPFNEFFKNLPKIKRLLGQR